MRIVPLACAAALLASCGGPAFTVGNSSDGGGGGGPDSSVSGEASVQEGGIPEGGGPVDALQEAPGSCSGAYACVPAVPSGWVGPVELFTGPTGQGPLPSCTAGYQPEEDAYDQLQAPAATCGCTCGAASVQCTAPQVTFNADTDCVTPTCATLTLTPNTCTPVNELTKCTAAVSGVYMTAQQATVSSASCPAQPTKSVPPVSWGLQARGCNSTVAPSQSDCASGSICAPKPAAPFGPTLCIANQGDALCPAGPYTAHHTFYTDSLDTRGCSACTCGDPASTACSANVDAYALGPDGGADCNGNKKSFGAPFNCSNVAQPASFLLTLTGSAGACTPSTPTATGTAIPTKPITVCCMP